MLILGTLRIPGSRSGSRDAFQSDDNGWEHMQDPMRIFDEYIAARGLKNTLQRRCIVKTFFQSPHHVSSEELYAGVRALDERTGQATVYRTLKLLCEAGLAKEMHFGDGIARYEPVLDDTHHDHLICNVCGKNIEVVDETIERLQEKLAASHGFELTSHRMYLYGVCAECRAHALYRKADPQGDIQ